MMEAITFDVDGTLYDVRAIRLPMIVANWRRLRALRVGVRVREELRGSSFTDGAALRLQEARIVAERLDIGVEAARALLDDIFDNSLSAILFRQRSDDTRRQLLEIVAAGTRIAAVSDRRIDDKLQALGLHDLPWAARISAEDTGWLKPDPRPFLTACERMGVEPGRALHVGDRDDTDGAGARAAGMRFSLVSGPREIARACR
jgi:FMN phosphatase YigB (HAD superfamily)